MIYQHYKDAEYDWNWNPYFKPKEIACRGTDELVVDAKAMDILLQARLYIDKPIKINSAYRSRLHNCRVGGAPKSAHRRGIAFDLSLAGHNKEELLLACKEAGFGSFGKYKTFLHVDTRRGRQWGSWD